MADPPPTDGPWDEPTLRALEARLDRAAQAAERLLTQTTAASGGDHPGDSAPAGDTADAADAPTPPGGWQRRSETGGRFDGWLDPADGELLLTLLAGLRDRLPVELQRRLAAALHELVLALHALVDWCLQRAERRRTTPRPVQDIPIL